MRVPAVDPERNKLIRHYERKLSYFQSIKSHRREQEAADEGEAICQAMLSHLRGNGWAEASNTGPALTLDKWLEEIEKEEPLDQG
jgi:hypothetical protein